MKRYGGSVPTNVVVVKSSPTQQPPPSSPRPPQAALPVDRRFIVLSFALSLFLLTAIAVHQSMLPSHHRGGHHHRRPALAHHGPPRQGPVTHGGHRPAAHHKPMPPADPLRPAEEEPDREHSDPPQGGRRRSFAPATTVADDEQNSEDDAIVGPATPKRRIPKPPRIAPPLHAAPRRDGTPLPGHHHHGGAPLNAVGGRRTSRQATPPSPAPTTTPLDASGDDDSLPSVSPLPPAQQQQQRRGAAGTAVRDIVDGFGTLGGDVHAEGLRITREAIRHSWKGYRQHAFGFDEYFPLSKGHSNWGSGRGVGVTIVDALDTMILAGLTDEVEQALQWIEQTLSFDQHAKLSVFETTIRVLGGLLSSYQLLKRPRLLELAEDLGRRLFYCFDTPSGIPDNYVDLASHIHQGASWNGGQAILSELGSLQIEFGALGQLTNNADYAVRSRRAVELIRPHCQSGFCPRFFSGTSPTGSHAGLGSFGDSFYEYLLKMWILSDKTDAMYEDMWQRAATHILKTSSTVGGHFVPNGQETGNVMEHLACFAGGLFTLSYLHTQDTGHLKAGVKIGDTCRAMYAATATKLAADVVRVSEDGSLQASDPKYILRPETMETYFYLWRATKHAKYRTWGLELMQAIDRHLRVEGGGYVGSLGVDSVPTPKNDNMETFWIGETLKYALLLFSDDGLLSLSEWVINTEAHPQRVFVGGGVLKGNDAAASSERDSGMPDTPPS